MEHDSRIAAAPVVLALAKGMVPLSADAHTSRTNKGNVEVAANKLEGLIRIPSPFGGKESSHAVRRCLCLLPMEPVH